MLTIPTGWRRPVLLVLAGLALLSLVPLWQESAQAVLIGLGAAAGLLLLARGSVYCRSLAVVLGAMVVPWLCLVAFNWLTRPVLEPLDLPLWPGLVLAGVIFAAAAWAYLVNWREEWLAAIGVAVLLAPANVVGVPLLLAGHGESHVSAQEPIVTAIDVAILVPGGAPRPLGGRPGAGPPADEWDVRWSVARVGAGGAPAWLLAGSADAGAALAAARGAGAVQPGAPAWRAGADHVVVLDVDGTPPVTPGAAHLEPVAGQAREIARWRRAAALAGGGARVVALLQADEGGARVARWRQALEPAGAAVATVQELGARTLTDAARVLAVQAPGAERSLALATRFRPVLLFDRAESPQTDTPLDVESLLASGRVTLCHDDQADGARCDPAPVRRSAELKTGPTHLRIRPARPSDPPVASAIYVHPTPVTRAGRRLLYLDYWWYLDGNPAREGHGASCGIGLAMPGKTCFDHPADWEGMTVVLDVSGADAVPVALQYAEHKFVVRYDYDALRRVWDGWLDAPPRWMSPELRHALRRAGDARTRPLAFVAQGTHASYWQPCARRRACRQVVSGIPEHRHDGAKGWAANDTVHCVVTRCVQLLPTRQGGRKAALWNAYGGVWGDRTCILGGAYCDYELSPSAPASQPRYQHPARIHAWADETDRAHRCGDDPPCPDLPAAREETAAG